MRRADDWEREVEDAEPEPPASEPAALARAGTVALNPATLAALQRTAGNAAVARAVQQRGGDRTLQRTKVKTNGGEFDDAPFYTPVSATGVKSDSVGANIGLDFTPGDLVEAPVDGVALVQTVKAVTDRKPGDAKLHATRDQTNTAVSTDKDESQLVAPNGAAVDVSIHRPGRKDANHNPIYGVGFGAAAPSTSLKDGAPSLGRSQRGAHVRDPSTGAFSAPVKAQMADGPRRTLEVDGQAFEMSFEVAAVVTHGPMANTYLGSIEWGWTSDAAGIVTVKPLAALASGAPTAAFMEAAGVWNKSTFHDKDKKKTEVASVDLPITTLPSGVQAAVDMTTSAIVARLPVVRAELAGMKAGPSDDRINKEFERRALETELAKRKVKIDLNCFSLSDTRGAAVPPEDEVWLALSGGGAPTLALTAQRKFRKGDTHSWQFPVKDFLPLDAAIKIEVNEHDRAGPGGRAHDDALIDFDWLPPFVPTVRFDKGAHYAAVIGFDK